MGWMAGGESGARDYALHRSVQTGSAVHPAS